jgi:hypothetical protein
VAVRGGRGGARLDTADLAGWSQEWMRLFQERGYPILVLFTLPCHTTSRASGGMYTTKAHPGGKPKLEEFRHHYGNRELAKWRAMLAVALEIQEHLALHCPASRVAWEAPATSSLFVEPMFAQSAHGLCPTCTGWGTMVVHALNYHRYWTSMDVGLDEVRQRRGERPRTLPPERDAFSFNPSDDTVWKDEIIASNIGACFFRPFPTAGIKRALGSAGVDLAEDGALKEWTARMPVRLCADLLRGALRHILAQLDERP